MIARRADRVTSYSVVYLRLALGVAFLSAVADRLGFWGAPGARNVAWGDFDSFLAYTATLNWFLPAPWVPAVGWAATFLELGLGVLLLVGFRVRETAFASGLLLFAFAATMTLATGLKSPLDASVFAASAGAFLLSAQDEVALSLDGLLSRRSATAAPLPPSHNA